MRHRTWRVTPLEFGPWESPWGSFHLPEDPGRMNLFSSMGSLIRLPRQGHFIRCLQFWGEPPINPLALTSKKPGWSPSSSATWRQIPQRSVPHAKSWCRHWPQRGGTRFHEFIYLKHSPQHLAHCKCSITSGHMLLLLSEQRVSQKDRKKINGLQRIKITHVTRDIK